jgi:hypothetical protein
MIVMENNWNLDRNAMEAEHFAKRVSQFLPFARVKK